MATISPCARHVTTGLINPVLTDPAYTARDNLIYSGDRVTGGPGRRATLARNDRRQ